MTAPAFTRVISIDAPPEAFAQLPAVQAMIGAVMEEAAKIAKACVYQYADPAPPILALGGSDALTALEAYRQRVRDETLEDAAKACDRRAGNASDFDRYTRRAAGMCAADIRAMKGPKP